MRDEEEVESGTWTGPGEDSPDSPETLSPDDGGDDPHERPSEPKQPSP
jgi:hypothetical protein